MPWEGRKVVEGKVCSGRPRGRWMPARCLWGTSPRGTPGEEGCFTIPDKEDEDTQRGVILEGTRVPVANQPLEYTQGDLRKLFTLLLFTSNNLVVEAIKREEDVVSIVVHVSLCHRSLHAHRLCVV